MFKRFRHISLLIILVSGALQALGQIAMPDKVCVDTDRRYWVTNGLPGSVFTWKINGAIQSSTVESIDITWSNVGVFNLQVQEHQLNCDGEIQFGIITVVDFPTLVIIDPPSVCTPSTIDLTASTITTGSDANLNFTYWTDAGGTTTLTNETSVSASGTYYIKATNPTGCSVIKPVSVAINPQPKLVITDPLAVCQPATVDLTAASVTGGSDAGLTYTYWTNPLATIALSNYNTVTETGSYFIKATNPVTGCSDIHVVNVIVNPLPKLVISDPATVCQPITIDLSASSVTLGSDAGLVLTYWTDASANTALVNYKSVSVSGTYYIKATNPITGCFVTNPVHAVIYDQPLAFAGLPETICPDSPYILANASAQNYSSLLWSSSGDGKFDDATKLNPVYTPGPGDMSLGTVTLTITAQGSGTGLGCVPAVSSVTLTIIRINASVSYSDVTCYGANNGQIIITDFSGGSGNYEYRVDGFGWQSKSQYLNLAPGDYKVEMRDLAIPACVRELANITIIQPDPLSATAQPQDATCLGNDGTISIINPDGGSGSYEYAMNDGAWTTTGYFTDLVPGNYHIDMRDLNVPDCTKDLGFVTIAMPIPVTAKVDKKDVSCYSGSDGQVIITEPKNGSGVYEFNIGTGWSSQMVFSDLTAGSYPVQMRDFNAKACVQDIGSVIISEPAPLAAILSHKDISCFGSNDGSITIQSPIGGSGTYEYTIDGTVWTGTTTYTNLLPGEYYVLMRDKNAPTCVRPFAAIEIIEPLPLAATVNQIDITCFGAHDGIIVITDSKNGTPGYEYTIDGISWVSTTTFSGLGTNTYTVQMRDTNGCKETVGIIFIVEPKPLIAVVNHTDETCVGNDGTITLTNPQNSVSGLYEFTIDGGSTWTSTDLFTGLASNTYTVKMRDANLKTCEQPLGNIHIDAPIPLAGTAVKTDVDCYGANNGIITVKNPIGGSGLYEYSVDGTTWTNTTTLANLSPAVYVLQMRDAKAISCEIQIGTYTVTQPEQLTATVSPADVSCYGGKDGHISFSGAKGGSGSFEYSVDGINWFANKIDNLIANTYAVQMRDAVVHSCVVSLGQVEIKEPAKITAKVDFTPVTCFGANDGMITITNPQNGIPPYQYSLDGVKWQAGNTFIGLPANVYDLLVISDANNCISTLAVITIIEPEKLDAKYTNTNETIPGANDGSITITGQKGGSGTFEYSKDGLVWQPEDTFTGLAPATYTILVRDANSITCIYPLTVNILPAGSLSAQYSFTPVTCFGGLNGSITFKNQNGATNYQFSVDGGASWGLVNQLVFSGLPAQQYTLVIRDADNIANTNTIATIEITQPEQLDAVVTATSETFAGAKDGAITISSPKGGSGLYDYSIDGTTWQASEQFAGLSSGIYNVQIRDRNVPTCFITIQRVIQPAGALIADVTHANVLCNGDASGSILFSNASGATSIEFSIDGGTKWQTSGVFNGLTAGPYETMIRDANNHANRVSLVKVTITEPTKLQASIINYTPPLCSGASGSFTIIAVGGTPPYKGIGDFVLPSGASRTFIVSDKNGCIATQSFTMPDPPKIIATAVLNPPKCYGENGTIVISATGGTGALKGTDTFIVQAGKAYSFKVTDANGCESNIVKGVMPPSEILAVKITPVSPMCAGSTVDLLISATGGTPGYTGTGTKTVSIGSGTTYTFTVTDSGGCSASASISISPQDPPEPPVIIVSVKPNCIVNTGTIEVTSPLGANYQYSLDGGTYTSATTFSKLATGSTHVVMLKDISTGCESVSTPITVDPLPDLPIAPVVDVNDPGCIVSTGSIKVTDPAEGSGFEYSLDGGTFISVATFANLLPGSIHNIVVRDMLTGCVSAQTVAKIGLKPINPTAPVATVTVKPTCNNPDGTVSVTSPLGANYEYMMNGKTQSSNVFVNVKTGTYTITVRDIKSGCESPQGLVVVPAIPPSPVMSLVSFENPKCFGETGTITFTMTNTTDGVYVIKYTGGQLSNVAVSKGQAIVAVPAGIYNGLSIEANGCNSDEIINVTIIQPSEIVITESITEIDLKSKTKGAINITATGGSPFSVADPYLYKWADGTTTKDIKNLNEGTYVITVTDKNGCTQVKAIKIPAPNFPPVARDDEFTSGCSGVNGNLYADNGKGIDYDPENDLFFVDVTPVESPKFGKLTINSDGTFVYLANPGYEGLDKFRYAIYDQNHYQGDTASVFIQVVSDFDGDGIPDLADGDGDGDGILNVDEVLAGQDWKTTDSDGDGHFNWLDIDSDNDGIVDNVEAQSTSGYIAPSGKVNKDGLDLAYDPAQGGTRIVPVDTDSSLADPDGIPDFLDSDSDNDHVPDYIEGYDGIDALDGKGVNADGKPNVIISGKDTDADGLDDSYDNVINGCNNGNSTGSYANATNVQDFDGDGIKDWRDDNDDDDEYLTRFEDLNADGDYSNDVTGHVGHPEYLWYGRDCELFIPDAFSPNNDNIHDYFQIYCIESYPNAHMYIFDQVGNKLYEKEHYGNLEFWGTPDQAWWDGTTTNRSATRNGNKVVTGTYYYVLRLGNGDVKKSFVFVSY